MTKTWFFTIPESAAQPRDAKSDKNVRRKNGKDKHHLSLLSSALEKTKIIDECETERSAQRGVIRSP